MSWWPEPRSAATKLGVFIAALGVLFAGAYGVGAFASPGPAAEPAHDGPSEHAGTVDEHASGGGGSGPGGLAVAADGFQLRAMSPPPAGGPGEFAFQIVDREQHPITSFQINHEKRLHLIVVRRDVTGFQHLHPEMSPDGTWRTPLALPTAGVWRVFADFRPDGYDQQVILGVDLQVGGDYAPLSLPEPAATTTVDGYTVAADGHLVAGRTSRLTLTISKGATPVTDLEPYLGAYGHLVALRAGDMAYLHVHPQETHASGPVITFDVEVPTPGTYRLFLDFQHGGVVHTAALTVTA
jgi:hypothetical protein